MLNYTHRSETEGTTLDNDIAVAQLQAMF